MDREQGTMVHFHYDVRGPSLLESTDPVLSNYAGEIPIVLKRSPGSSAFIPSGTTER